MTNSWSIPTRQKKVDAFRRTPFRPSNASQTLSPGLGITPSMLLMKQLPVVRRAQTHRSHSHALCFTSIGRAERSPSKSVYFFLASCVCHTYRNVCYDLPLKGSPGRLKVAAGRLKAAVGRLIIASMVWILRTPRVLEPANPWMKSCIANIMPK